MGATCYLSSAKGGGLLVYPLCTQPQWKEGGQLPAMIPLDPSLATPSLRSTGKLITFIIQLIQEVYWMPYRRFAGLATLLVCL